MSRTAKVRRALGHDMTPAQQIALWADKLRDMSALGLLFSNSVYDRANYQTVQQIAMEMLALATARPVDEIEPLRMTMFSRPTPHCVGDAAIIDDAGKILLIRRADNQKWAMPGGGFAVGETPAQGAVREALEETGVRCKPIAFVGVHDSRLCGTISAFHMYQFCFLCQPVNAGKPEQPATHVAEVLDARWFPENGLPEDVDPGHVSRIREAFRVWRGDGRAYFDR